MKGIKSMECIFRQNSEFTYIENDYVKENEFARRSEAGEQARQNIPKFSEIKDKLPEPIWDNHKDITECYYKTWEIAFKNLSNPMENSGFVSPFIDTAFNGNLFMWDSSFILMFCKYAAHIFDFQQTLDNFYAKQHKDGFICREIGETNGNDRFTRFDPAATGPNIMPWCEWEYYLTFKDTERLRRVFPCLLAYHKWLKDNHTWRDGSYWSSGFGCGMDNITSRVPKGEHTMFSNAHMVWADTNFQQILSGKILVKMAKVLKRENEEIIAEIEDEITRLEKYANERLWDEETAYYYDLWRDDRFNYVKTVGSYWAMLAEAVPENRIERFIEHLENKEEFNRPHRVPSVSADDPNYKESGGYWNGAVWAPTNYMVLKGLERYGYDELAYDIALNHLENVTKVFKDTNTLWENYAPEYSKSGDWARTDFVGWTGLAPVAVLFEYVFGIRANENNNKIVWHINRTERHGVINYPIGGGITVDLICGERKNSDERPLVEIKSPVPLSVELIWNGQSETLYIK